MAEDIRKTGIGGLRGLTYEPNPLNRYLSDSRRTRSISQSLLDTRPAERSIGLELADLGYGLSKYDKEVSDLTQARNLEEFRAEVQPWYDQVGNGILKMLSTAGTTFIDGTLGALVGLGTGIYNLADNDPRTGFWRGMWDNAVTNAMAEVNNAMEESFKNYRTEWEQNAPFWQRMFSGQGAANFWADDILKNAGFTLGAAASLYVTGGLGGLMKGTSWAGKAARFLKLARLGEESLEATRFGKVASWVANSFVSSQGEAAIEAVNAMRDNREVMQNNINSRVQEQQQEALSIYQQAIADGVDPEVAKGGYEQRMQRIAYDKAKAEYEMDAQLADAGNTIYAANIAALTVSNNLTLGSLIRGGYGNAKSLLEGAVKTAGGKPITNVKEAGKALLKGDLRFNTREVQNVWPKATALWAATSTQEGLEEGVQNLASTSGQMVSQARVNKYVEDNTMLGTMINPEAEEQLIEYHGALRKALEDQFGAANSQGWTEVAAGFISGALGSFGGFRKNAQGKYRPTWNGGILEAKRTILGNRPQVQEQVDRVNKALTDNKFNERVKHAVQSLAIKSGQEDALTRGDQQAYKNLEVQQLVSDAIFFREMGMLDDYLEMVSSMAESVSDQDITELRAAAKQENGEASHLEKMSDDEIKEYYSGKAKRTAEKVKRGIETYDTIEKKYGPKFSDETRREAMTEMSFLDTLYWDTQRRVSDLDDRIEELRNKGEKITPLEEEELNAKERASKKLLEQAKELKYQLDEYKSKPKKLQEEIESRQLTRQKKQLYKKADQAIAKYKEANTIKDILDVYSHSPEEDRDAVLNQAIEQTDDEDVKNKLTLFKNYINDVDTIQGLIRDRFPLTDESNALLNFQYLQAFNNLLNNTVNEMLEDEETPLDRATLANKFQEKLDELEAKLQDAKGIAQSVVLDDDGNFDIQEALDSGLISEDEFDKNLEDEETGAYSMTAKEGSNADRMLKAAQDVKGLLSMIDHLNYFINSLDKLDELRKAGVGKKKKKTSGESKKKETKSGKATDFSVESLDDDSTEGDDEIMSDGSSREEPEKSKKPSEEDILTDKEKENYTLEREAGKYGVSYYRSKPKKNVNKSVKDAHDKKKKKAHDKVEMLLNNFDRAETEKDKKKVADSIIDIVNSTPLFNNTIKLLESFFAKNASYVKPTTAESTGKTHDNRKGQQPRSNEVSLNGNQHPAYVESELNKNKKMVEVTYMRSGETPIQVWLKEQGYDIQGFIDNQLGKIIANDSEKKVEDRTKIYYLHSLERPEELFLGIKYEDVKDIVTDKNLPTVVINGTRYILTGTLGWNDRRAGTEEMYKAIMEETVEFHDLATTTFSMSEVSEAFNNIFLDSSIEKGKGTYSTNEEDPIDILQKLIEEKADKLSTEDLIKEFFDTIKFSVTIADVTIKGKDVWEQLDKISKNDKLKPRLRAAIEKAITNKDSDSETTNSEWAVNENHTNRIKDLSAGAIVKQIVGDKSPKVRDVSELLEATRNPRGLKIGDIGWTIILGTDEKKGGPRKVTPKHINSNPEEVFNISGARPGQVYMHIPTADGKYVPVYVEAVFYNELDKDTKLGNEIRKQVEILANKDASDEAKRTAIGKLNDYLIFSKPNQIHLNLDGSKVHPNTIYITRNGIPTKIIDFEEETGTVEDLLKAIELLNPRVNISSSVLESSPEYYLESGVLRTDIGLLGTVNAKIYLYPVDSDNNYVENKVAKTSDTKSVSAPDRERVYLNGKYVYIDSKGTFYNSTGSKIVDGDGSLRAAYEIKQGTYKDDAITYNKNLYYDIRGTMYMDNGHGGIVSISDKERKRILAINSKKASSEGKKENIKKKAEEIKGKKKAAEKVEDTTLSAMPQDLPEQTWDALKKGAAERTVSGTPVLTGEYIQRTLVLLRAALDRGIIRNIDITKNEDSTNKNTTYRITVDDWDSAVEQLRDKLGFNTPKELGYINPDTFNFAARRREIRQKRKEAEKGKESKRPEAPKGPANFGNGVDAAEKSQEEIDKQLETNTLTNILRARKNEAKKKELITLMNEKFKLNINSVQALVDALVTYKIDISSNDLDTIKNEIEHCR